MGTVHTQGVRREPLMLWAPAKAQRQEEVGFLEEMESGQGDGAAGAKSRGHERRPFASSSGQISVFFS